MIVQTSIEWKLTVYSWKIISKLRQQKLSVLVSVHRERVTGIRVARQLIVYVMIRCKRQSFSLYLSKPGVRYLLKV